MKFTGSATSSASSLFPDLAAHALGAAGGGKAERESRQQARFASHADPAAVQLRDRLDDRQTENGAGRGFLARAEIGRAHVRTPVTRSIPIPTSSLKKETQL